MDYLGWRRKLAPVLAALLLVSALLLLQRCLITSQRVQAQLQPYRVNRNLSVFHEILQEPLIEPRSSRTLCEDLREEPVLVLVTSSPARYVRRQVIRETWGKEVPTFFFLGLEGVRKDELADIYYESKLHNDLIVFEFIDSYQNLTLKTAAMLQWGARRCPGVHFVLKTDDDVVVNPRRLRAVARDHAGDALVGYRLEDGSPHRSPLSKYYLPRWLYPEDHFPDYLSGTGYLINGAYLPKIVEASYKVPLINLEDVYFTYLVAGKTLGLSLAHDDRLSPFQPILPLACAYWDFALMHSMAATTMANVWSKIELLAKDDDAGVSVCEGYKQHFRYFSSYYFLQR